MSAPAMTGFPGTGRARRSFAAVLAAVSLVGFGAMTASADKPADPGSNGKGHDKGTVSTPTPPPTTTTSGSSTGTATATSTGSTTGPGAGNITTPGKTGPGDNNRGDTWLQTVGPCADHNAEVLNHDADGMSGCNLAVAGGNPEFEPPAEPSAENLQFSEIGTVESTNPDHNPHLPCANIEVMGKDMGDATGSYSIDYWPPTGNKGAVYGKNSDGSSALSLAAMINGDADVTNNGTWKYTATPTTLSKQGKTGGYQVMDIVDVSALVHNAQLINPDPQDIQGYHFKLQFSQDPQKHKTFWVKCAAPAPPPQDCDGDTDGSKTTDADCQGPQDCDGDHNGSVAADADCQGPQDCDGDHNGSVAADADCQGPVDCDGDHNGSVASDADCQGPVDCDGDHNGSVASDADCGGTAALDCDGNSDGSHMVNGVCDGTQPVTSVLGASTGVLGASTTNPFTGHPLLSAMVLAIALVIGGAGLLVAGRRRGRTGG